MSGVIDDLGQAISAKSSSTDTASSTLVDPVGSASAELGWRIASLLSGYRLLVGTGLLIAFAALNSPRAVGAHVEQLFQFVAFAYCGLGIVGLIAAWRRVPIQVLQIRAALLADVFAVPLLLHASGGAPSGLGNLIIVSVGASSLILPRRTALLYAALAAIAILTEQVASFFEGLTLGADFVRAGLVGAVTLLLSIVAQPVSQRLRESEALARQRGVDLANLAELNNYIIQHLRESILVLDTDDTVRLINGTAARHLGHNVDVVGRPIQDLYPPLAERAMSWRKDGQPVNATPENFMSADGTTLLTPHIAPIGDGDEGAAALIFLEDATALAERVQQSKLAALGRLSASIAHEIRNPVGAISHAGQLLGESERLGEQEQRLTQIIHDHCGRVNNIVKNVLQLSRRDHAEPQQVELHQWLEQFVLEFSASRDSGIPAFTLAIEPGDVTVRMDPTHLHQVMWNLCSNAVRYALEGNDAESDAGLAIRASRLAGTQRPFVEVLDRGPGIDERFRQNVFEPFFTRAKDGTGLGLFLARELCEVNRATLVYEPRDGGGSCFRIIFADPKRWTY